MIVSCFEKLNVRESELSIFFNVIIEGESEKLRTLHRPSLWVGIVKCHCHNYVTVDLKHVAGEYNYSRPLNFTRFT